MMRGRSGVFLSAALLALALAGCAGRPNAPLVNIWRQPGVHDVLGISVETERHRITIRDPGCGVFVLRGQRELGSYAFAYRYEVESASELTPECAIAAEANSADVGSSVDGEAERQLHPLGGNLSYRLIAPIPGSKWGGEPLLARYFDHAKPPLTINERETARRNGGARLAGNGS